MPAPRSNTFLHEFDKYMCMDSFAKVLCTLKPLLLYQHQPFPLCSNSSSFNCRIWKVNFHIKGTSTLPVLADSSSDSYSSMYRIVGRMVLKRYSFRRSFGTRYSYNYTKSTNLMAGDILACSRRGVSVQSLSLTYPRLIYLQYRTLH